MNKGSYGYPLPPSTPRRVAPPEWKQVNAFLSAGPVSFTVPQNVYQLRAIALGGGADGFSLMDANPPGKHVVFKYGHNLGITITNLIPSASNEQHGAAAYFQGKYYGVNTGGSVKVSPNLCATGAPAAAQLGGDGYYLFTKDDVMVGIPTSGIPLYTTQDGVTWTSRPNNPAHSTSGMSFCWGDSKDSAVWCGLSTGLAYTTTGFTTVLSVAKPASMTSIKGIAYGAGVFVIAGQGAAADQGLCSSPTGATWTARASGTGVSNAFNAVRFLNGNFIAVGNGGLIVTSTDGENWTIRTSGIANNLDDLDYDSVNNLYIVLAGSSTGKILTSPDLVTWTQRTISSNANPMGSSPNPSALSSVRAYNGCIVVFCSTSGGASTVLGSAITAFTSIDSGLTWKSAGCAFGFSSSTGYTNVKVLNGKFISTLPSANGAFTYSIPRECYGGGGGGYAEAIIDVVPGQVINGVVGSSGGTTSIGAAISATGGSTHTGAGGSGFAVASLRGVSTANGGQGSACVFDVEAPSVNSLRKAPGGGGGAAGWLGRDGGNGGETMVFPSNTAYQLTSSSAGAGGGGLFGGHGGSAFYNTSSSPGLGGGGGGAGGSGSNAVASIPGSGGGSVTSATSSRGGSGYTCSGGLAASTGVNGSNPSAVMPGSALSILLSGVFDGAGGGGATSTGTAGDGSGFGGGGGGMSTATSGAAGSGSPCAGGGGGGGPANSTASGSSGGDGGFGGGGGGAGGISGGTRGYYNVVFYGGNGGIGGGGGCGGINFIHNGSDASRSGENMGSVFITAGAKVGGAGGFGGNGAIIFQYTEGY